MTEKEHNDTTTTVTFDRQPTSENYSPQGQVRGFVSKPSQGSSSEPISPDAVHLGAAPQPDNGDAAKTRRNRKPTVGKTRGKVVPLPEIHSGMLTDSCPRRVKLRIEGKSVISAPTALYRGVLIGEVVSEYHNTNTWEEKPTGVVASMSKKVLAAFEKEGRVITDSVEKNMADIHAEVETMTELYIARFADRFKKATLIGCELPCRMQIGKVKFASHIDLMFRDNEGNLGGAPGQLVVWDWKCRQDAPTRSYLSRNLQLALYWLMVSKGSICTVPQFGLWTTFGEVASVAWCHLPALKPFARATTVQDDDGTDRQYVKGDFRPERNIVRDCGFRDGLQPIAEDEILMRVELMRRGLDIAIPDPVGCHLCECEPWCRRFDTAELGTRHIS